ncbi:hypothetical protein AVEN_126275-1 [Araneus ventricosus]|uniref:Uncharacterized protein n=1 Tax=Araneus ventricosus TaxID=182803 RepID=A0A4Y2VYQ8_ARAVE|nr:hypothetical protein AVEN_126275-1 [Araneus ventricosus]
MDDFHSIRINSEFSLNKTKDDWTERETKEYNLQGIPPNGEPKARQNAGKTSVEEIAVRGVDLLFHFRSSFGTRWRIFRSGCQADRDATRFGLLTNGKRGSYVTVTRFSVTVF